MNCPHHPNTPGLVYCPECRAAEEKPLCPSDAAACSAAPGPWSFDVSTQETPPARRSATIYAADSTRVCQTHGEHAEALAKLIVESVNHCLPNAQGDGSPDTNTQAEYSAYRRMAEHAKQMERERNEAQMMRNWDNRAISIARHYGHEDSRRSKHDFEDGRIRPALVLEKAVAVAIDGWVDGNSVTIQLCREEVEQWVALVCVHGQDVTAFSVDEMGLCEDVQEVWMSSAVLAALDHARAMPAESDSSLNADAMASPPLTPQDNAQG